MTNSIPRKVFPGFDLLRILAAVLVVFSHSFLIAEGTEKNEPSQIWTGEIFGIYGVMVFFILSGFLVSDSAIHSASFKEFSVKRIRRIAPAFLVSTVYCTLVLGSIYSVGGASQFLSDPASWRHMLDVLTFQEPSLVFQGLIEIYPPTEPGLGELSAMLNGVLWTIRLEVTCYALVGLLLIFSLLTAEFILALAVLATIAAFSYSWQVNDYVVGLFFLLPSFVAGMILRIIGYSHIASGKIAAFSFAMLIIFAINIENWGNLAFALFPMFATYCVLWFGQLNFAALELLKKFGDPSYGIYIWGWPVQQVLRSWLGPDLSGYTFAAICIPITIAVGYVSWHLIEKPFVSRNFFTGFDSNKPRER